MRNRPQLDLIRRIASRRDTGAVFRIAVLGCSLGAEVYSIVWVIRSERADLQIRVHAIDLSQKVLELAREGTYSLTRTHGQSLPVCNRLTETEIEQMFERKGDCVRIKPWLKTGISWQRADAGDPRLAEILGSHDLVVANNFLCHMQPQDAERCLRNFSGLVQRGGYLVVSGVDLDIRTGVARELSWKPIVDSLEEIHEGDSSLRGDWPWRYWGLEPLDKTRPDWRLRYASVFRIGEENER